MPQGSGLSMYGLWPTGGSISDMIPASNAMSGNSRIADPLDIHNPSQSPPTYYYPQFSVPNLTNLVTVKLTSHEDYLTWKNQLITCLLISQNLFFFLDGSSSIPPSRITDDQGTMSHNPHFYEYLRIDQCVRSCLYATLSREVLTDVHELNSSTEIWSRLQYRFMQASLPRSMEL